MAVVGVKLPTRLAAAITQDFLIPAGRAIVEVKVTRPGRRNRHIHDEILVDTEAYQQHHGVDRMVFVIYDLAGTVDNPAGFGTDLSREVDGHPRDVLVVR